MDFLKKPLQGSRGTKTIVDLYVEKQKLYTGAQMAWDAIRDKNAGVWFFLLHGYASNAR